MAESIISLIASIIGILAAWGLDALMGKWVAYFTIAWETKASAAARKAAAEAVASYKKSSQNNYRTWRDLRRVWVTQQEDSDQKNPT